MMTGLCLILALVTALTVASLGQSVADLRAVFYAASPLHQSMYGSRYRSSLRAAHWSARTGAASAAICLTLAIFFPVAP